MKVRAAILREMGRTAPYIESQPLTMETVDLAPPGLGNSVCACWQLVCATQTYPVIDGSRPRPMPMVLGHETTGEIVELGADVEGFRVGDRVICSFVPSCGRCTPCASGRAALCEPGAEANTAGTLLGGGRRWRDAHGMTLQTSSRSLRICRIYGCVPLTRSAHRPRSRPGDRGIVSDVP